MTDFNPLQVIAQTTTYSVLYTRATFALSSLLLFLCPYPKSTLLKSPDNAFTTLNCQPVMFYPQLPSILYSAIRPFGLTQLPAMSLTGLHPPPSSTIP